MMTHVVIEPLTPLWLKMIIFSLAFIALPILLVRHFRIRRDIVRVGLGILLLGCAIIMHPFLLSTNSWNLRTSLPLQLCSLSGLLSGIVLLFPSQLGYELLMYWGITGALHALLTPEMTYGTGDFILIEYFISHSGIIGAAIFLTFSFNMQLRKNSWWKIFLMTQILLPIVGAIDYFLESNYMYLRSRPEANNPLIIGPWPWYILAFEVLLLIHFYLVYLLFSKVFRRAIIPA